MKGRPSIDLDPVPDPMPRSMTLNLSERDYQRFKVLAEKRGEKGVSPLIRQLALKALESLES